MNNKPVAGSHYAGMAGGLILGITIGIAQDNIGVGVGIGFALAVAMAWLSGKRDAS